jgi:hypothetical protein
VKTFSANSIAEQFERDRGVVVRALRNTKPDAMVSGRPQWKLSSASRALEKHNRANDGGGSNGGGRLAEIADELERLSSEADAAIEVVKSKRGLTAKQPHSRAAMVLINRIDALYKESNDLLLERDPTSLAQYVTGPIIGSTFRELLAAIYGRDVEIDGVKLFPDYHRNQRAAK